MGEQRQDQIDRYIRGEMTAEECKRFERLLDENAALREEYEFTKQVQEALKRRSARLRLMEQWNKEAEQQAVGVTDRHRHRWIFGVAGGSILAAVLIAVIFLFVPSRWGPAPEERLPQLDMTLYEHYRSGSPIRRIACFICQKQYEKALLCIRDEEKKVLSAPESLHPATDEERKRMEREVVAARRDADHLKWLKVYALIGLDRQEEARKVLDEMRRSLGPYRQKADSLYRLLR